MPAPKAAKQGLLEVLIHGELYDVSEFAKRHPGGSVIKFGVGTDMTAAFDEFHSRTMPRVSRVLKSLPKRKPSADELKALRATDDGQEPAVIRDFVKLRAELVRDGFFEPSYVHVAYRMAELIFMQAFGLYLAHCTSWYYTGVAIFSIGNARCGWFMHEGGHVSLTGSAWWDKRLQNFVVGLGVGMSGSYWNNQHNKHHATPQKLQHDVDLRTLPLISFDHAVSPDASPMQRAWLRLQSALFTPLSCMIVVWFWSFLSHPRHALRSRQWEEVFWIVGRWLLVVFVNGWPIFFMSTWFGGGYIFTNFSLSHTHRPVVKDDEHVNWVAYSSEYTVDIAPGYLCDWWMGYLNYQIEHHLFPSMPQFRQGAVAPRVRRFLHKHGYPYHVLGYWEALQITLRNLHEVGNDLPSSKEAPIHSPVKWRSQ